MCKIALCVSFSFLIKTDRLVAVPLLQPFASPLEDNCCPFSLFSALISFGGWSCFLIWLCLCAQPCAFGFHRVWYHILHVSKPSFLLLIHHAEKLGKSQGLCVCVCVCVCVSWLLFVLFTYFARAASSWALPGSVSGSIFLSSSFLNIFSRISFLSFSSLTSLRHLKLVAWNVAEGTPRGPRLVVLVKGVMASEKDKDGRSARKPLITRNAIFSFFGWRRSAAGTKMEFWDEVEV